MKLLITGALRSYTGAAEVELDLGAGATLAAMFDALESRYPGLRFRVVDEQQRLRPNLRLFVDGVGVRDLAHGLRRDAAVALVLALSGG
ncbi:MAG: MoaD/ThiS family protein [Burkholderiales bacterium]|nr:MoaD/ThiS family protein [Burkholderiales bacterium]MDE1926148.1 MoaD/ThiS family protein [Burkholderiales bacterium]MDE2161246.1 MoaD/ThiS family protein [Burkholderiales bacterium]MDE2502928.1 MoaD/ThiS family protein [Burkholderiales bacterium]